MCISYILMHYLWINFVLCLLQVSRRPLFSSDDGQWSEGLISAARLVAAATHSLVESANGLVQGVSGEEKLVSAAKQVASSTAQLLVACKVKADPDSASTKRLQVSTTHSCWNLINFYTYQKLIR